MQVTEEDIKHGAALMQWAMWLVNNWRVLLATLAAIAALQVVQYFRRKASKPFLNPEEYQVCEGSSCRTCYSCKYSTWLCRPGHVGLYGLASLRGAS